MKILICTLASGWYEKLAPIFEYTAKKFNPGCDIKVFYKRDLPPARTTRMTLRISGLRPGRYAATFYKVGYRVNDAYATYCDLGSPSQLTRDQVAFIKDKNNGAPHDTKVVTIGDNGAFFDDYEVRENDLCLVTLSPLQE